ncbi:MAG: glycosyltransferase family 2 protein [Prevotellaceae bacterium]|jgi:GT2 family glycosyltransferase|nr:glycosyltransferase family 2 protein [Prevotellaceae bacterium]
MKKTAIVILNWNGKDFLEKFLPPLFAHTPENQADIYVADNNSADNSIDFLKNNFPAVQIIQLAENYGFAGGYNRALEQVDAEYFVLLNNDIEVAESWLQPIIEYLDNHSDTAAAQPKILSYAQKKQFEYAGAAGGFIDKWGFPFCRGRIFGTVEQDNNQYDNELEIFWATGACLVIRSADFWTASGFDEDFFAHQEEIDLCWRLRSSGRKIACIPQSVVYHVGGGTLTVESPRKTYLNFRNNLLLLYKNLPENRLRKVMFARWFFDYLAAFQMFISGKSANAKQIFKARHDFCKIKKRFSQKRKENLEKTVLTEIPEMLPQSIVFQYYIKGKKYFNKLNSLFL